jgi:hypothetical protein
MQRLVPLTWSQRAIPGSMRSGQRNPPVAIPQLPRGLTVLHRDVCAPNPARAIRALLCKTC